MRRRFGLRRFTPQNCCVSPSIAANIVLPRGSWGGFLARRMRRRFGLRRFTTHKCCVSPSIAANIVPPRGSWGGFLGRRGTRFHRRLDWAWGVSRLVPTSCNAEPVVESHGLSTELPETRSLARKQSPTVMIVEAKSKHVSRKTCLSNCGSVLTSKSCGSNWQYCKPKYKKSTTQTDWAKFISHQL